QYEHFSKSESIHEDLISAYLGIDPLGYVEQVREALEFLDKQLGSELTQRRHYLDALKREYYVHTENLDAALAHALHTLELSAQEKSRSTAMHYSVFAYSDLCLISHRRGDWERLGEWAELGLEAARAVGHQMERAEFLLWQACVQRKQGEQSDALRK